MTPIYSGGLDVAPESEGISTLPSSFGERFSASVGETVDSLPTVGLFRAAKTHDAAGDMIGPGFNAPGVGWQSLGDTESLTKSDIPDISIADAKAKVRAAKLDNSITLPEQDSIKAPVLDLMIEHAQQQRERQTTIARGPQGFLPGALDVGTSFLVGAMDPINLAAFSIPVLGEAGYAKLMAGAGESVLARAGVRGATGAAQGAVGSTVLQPLDYYIHTQDGQDYTMAQALENIIMGAGTGGLMHATGFPFNLRGGVFGEAYRAIRGRPLDLEPSAARENVPSSVRDSIDKARAMGASVETTVPDSHEASERAVIKNAVSEHMAMVDAPLMDGIDNLPPRAKEDVMHGAIANLIQGEPVRIGEMLDVAGRNDPRITESFEPSSIPTDTEISKARTGEWERVDSELAVGFQELGQSFESVPKDIKDRAAHIMYTEGVEDPIAAYERAVMEADYYAEKSGKIERIQGNELPAETRTAPNAGSSDQREGRPGGIGETARESSPNDKRASDAEWQRLARGPDNDAAIERSQEVAKLPDPFSTIATKSREAAEKMAAEIEDRFKAMADGGLLPEEAKAQIDEIVLKAKQYEVDWSEAVKSGISCLAAGAAGAVI